jgi:hypothetical protein
MRLDGLKAALYLLTSVSNACAHSRQKGGYDAGRDEVLERCERHMILIRSARVRAASAQLFESDDSTVLMETIAYVEQRQTLTVHSVVITVVEAFA